MTVETSVESLRIRARELRELARYHEARLLFEDSGGYAMDENGNDRLRQPSPEWVAHHDQMCKYDKQAVETDKMADEIEEILDERRCRKMMMREGA